MNAVEIEAAISDLALQSFDAAEFLFVFLAAFDNKETTLKRLRAGDNTASDVPDGVLQHNNIHIATYAPGALGATLQAVRGEPGHRPGQGPVHPGDRWADAEGWGRDDRRPHRARLCGFRRPLGRLPAAGRYLHHRGDQGQTPSTWAPQGG